MADYNKCYFEGTIWQPTLKTGTTGKSTWTARLSVYKKKGTDGKTEYTPVTIRTYGAMADRFAQEYRERDKVAVTCSYRSEKWNEKYYNFFVIEDMRPQPVENNSPYAQSYNRKPAERAAAQQADLFAQEIKDAVEIQDDDLPF